MDKKNSASHELHIACQQGNLKAVNKLMEASDISRIINLNSGILGYTPLHEATSRRNAEIVESLLENGASVNVISNGDYTPLHIGASVGSVACIELLLKYNADISMKDEFGKTPYDMAIVNNRKAAARILKTAEVKRSVIDDNGKNLGKMIEKLQSGVEVTESCYGECLEIAVRSNHHFAAGFIILRFPTNILKCLQLAMSLPNSVETAAMILLCLAARSADHKLVELLFKNPKQQDINEFGDNCHAYKCQFLQQRYFNAEQLYRLQRAVKVVDHAFPVSLACNSNNFKVAKVLLFNTYCDHVKLEADWNSLSITAVQEDWICDISKFEKLLLGWNVITQLPTNIGSLNNLLRLDLQHNQITIVPGCLFELQLLRHLNLSHNQIQELPVVGQCSPSLNYLNVSFNLLSTFPSDIIGAEIEYLNLSSNKFNKIPLGVCQLKTLISLDVSENKEITELPIELGKLTSLISFNYNGLHINDPPAIHQMNTASLIKFLRARLRSSVTYNTMKLMLIGNAYHGKTTLMHRLKGDESFNENISTQGVNIQEIYIHKRTPISSFPTFTFRVWDFAGQEEYYATHQCFLSERSLYLLVWDMTEGKSGILGLKPWLDNLAARISSPYVIIIGTKLDLVEGEIDEKSNFELINELIHSEPTYTNIKFELVINVSSELTYKDYRKVMDKLKRSIYDVADRMMYCGVKVMGEQVPYIYQHLEKELLEERKEKLRNGKVPILTHDEYLNIIRKMKCSKDTFESDDFDIATQFLHNIGSILHYNDPNQDLKDLYFICPSWISRLMAKVITVSAGHNFFKNGILQVEKLRLIVGERNEDFPPNFYEKYMRLLNRFQICCSMDKDRLLVPSKLPTENLTSNDVDVSELLTRYHIFPYIPYGFWSRLISRLLMLLKEMLSQDIPSHIQKYSVSNDFEMKNSEKLTRKLPFITNQDDPSAMQYYSRTYQTSENLFELSVDDNPIYNNASPKISEIQENYEIYKLLNEMLEEVVFSIENKELASHEDYIYDKNSIKFSNIGSLLDTNVLTCWKTGVVFNHPKLYFSVQQGDSDNKVVTTVSNSSLGWRALSFIIDNIRILIKEWYPGLHGHDGTQPYILQHIVCPLCKKEKIKQPHSFNIMTLFHNLCDDNPSVTCANKHSQIINVGDLCPELVFKDLPNTLQIQVDKLHYKDQPDHMLGYGAFGKVYRAQYNGVEAAVKEYTFIRDSVLATSLDLFFDIRQEIFILSKLQHNPFIVKFLGFSIYPKLCAVMERAYQGTLKDALFDRMINIKRIVKFRIAQQVACGLAFIHSKYIIHRDVKPDNILLFSLEQDAQVNVKLTDFGTSHFRSPCGLNDIIGTPGFIAPEMYDFCSSDEYTNKVDIYSFGMVLYEMIACREPFHELSNGPAVTSAVRKGQRPYYKDVTQSYYGLPSMTQLMIKMWHQECSHRPKSIEVLRQLNHPAFQLLYGIKIIRSQNPRFFCFVQLTHELWLVCDGAAERTVTIIDLSTASVKETFSIAIDDYSITTFNLVSIFLIDPFQVAIILRADSDIMLTYSVYTKKILHFIVFEIDLVSALCASVNYIFIGYQNGTFRRFSKRNLAKRKMKKDAIKVDTKLSCRISGILSTSDNVIVSCGNYVMLYSLEFNNDRVRKLMKYTATQQVAEIILSYDEQHLFVSFIGSSLIIFLHLQSLQEISHYDIESIIQGSLHQADRNDTRITCMCSVLDVLWIGTGSGHILMFEVSGDNNFDLLLCIKPYLMETRSLCLVELENSTSNEDRYLILSSGKAVNNEVFGMHSLCKLNGDFLTDSAFPKIADGKDRPHKLKFLLMWQVLDSRDIRNMRTY